MEEVSEVVSRAEEKQGEGEAHGTELVMDMQEGGEGVPQKEDEKGDKEHARGGSEAIG